MARIRQRQEQRRLQGGSTATATPLGDHLDFISDRVFDPPELGIYQGQLVKVHERGNTKGMSATLWITDRLGTNQIVSFGQVRMVNPEYIAPTVAQFDELLDTLQLETATTG